MSGSPTTSNSSSSSSASSSSTLTSGMTYSLSHNECSFNNLSISNASSALLALLLAQSIALAISASLMLVNDDLPDTGHLLASEIRRSMLGNFTTPSRVAGSSSCISIQCNLRKSPSMVKFSTVEKMVLMLLTALNVFSHGCDPKSQGTKKLRFPSH